MKTDRRNFIKAVGVAGTGMITAGMTGVTSGNSNKQSDPFANTKKIS
jgi:hypothetical protein